MVARMGGGATASIGAAGWAAPGAERAGPVSLLLALRARVVIMPPSMHGGRFAPGAARNRRGGRRRRAPGSKENAA